MRRAVAVAVRDAQLAAGPPVAGDTIQQPGADVPAGVVACTDAGTTAGNAPPDRHGDARLEIDMRH